MSASTGDSRRARSRLTVVVAWAFAFAAIGLIAGPTLLSRAITNTALLSIARAEHSCDKASDAILGRVQSQLERALRLQAANSGALRGLGWVHFQRGDATSAAQAWRSSGLYANTALAAAEQSQRARSFALAAHWYGYATALAPRRADVWMKLGLCHERLGAWNTAARVYREGLEQATDTTPGLSSLHWHLGIVLSQHTTPPDLEGAVQAFSAALRADAFLRDSQRPQALRQRGDLLLKLGRPARALEDYVATLAINPDQYWPLYELGRLYVTVLDDSDAAIASLRRAIELQPERKVTYLRLAALHERLGDTEAAIGAYRAALDLDPRDGTASKALARLEMEPPDSPDGGTDR